MDWLRSIKGWLYAAMAAAVMAYVAKHPEFHEVALVFLGIIAHELGVQTEKHRGGNGNGTSS